MASMVRLPKAVPLLRQERRSSSIVGASRLRADVLSSMISKCTITLPSLRARQYRV